MPNLSYDTHYYADSVLHVPATTGTCGLTSKIKGMALKYGDKISYGHGLYPGQKCGECVFVQCAPGLCTKPVFAHMRVDDPYRPGSGGSQ